MLSERVMVLPFGFNRCGRISGCRPRGDRHLHLLPDMIADDDLPDAYQGVAVETGARPPAQEDPQPRFREASSSVARVRPEACQGQFQRSGTAVRCAAAALQFPSCKTRVAVKSIFGAMG